MLARRLVNPPLPDTIKISSAGRHAKDGDRHSGYAIAVRRRTRWCEVLASATAIPARGRRYAS